MVICFSLLPTDESSMRDYIYRIGVLQEELQKSQAELFHLYHQLSHMQTVIDRQRDDGDSKDRCIAELRGRIDRVEEERQELVSSKLIVGPCCERIGISCTSLVAHGSGSDIRKILD